MAPPLRTAVIAAWACAATAVALPALAANEAATPAAALAAAVVAPAPAAAAATTTTGLRAGSGCGPFVLPMSIPYNLPCPAGLTTYDLATVPGSPYYTSKAPAGAQAPRPTAAQSQGPAQRPGQVQQPSLAQRPGQTQQPAPALRPTPAQSQAVTTVVWDSPQSTAPQSVFQSGSFTLVPDQPYTRAGLASPPALAEVPEGQTTLATVARGGGAQSP